MLNLGHTNFQTNSIMRTPCDLYLFTNTT